MELTEQSIQQFIQGQLSIKDAKEIISLLNTNPNWVNQYFTEDEWAALKEAEIEKLSQESLQNTWSSIQSKAFLDDNQKARPRVVFMWVAAASVAASILLFFVIGSWIHENGINKSAVSTTINDTLFKQNNTDTVQLLTLSDGSSIELNPQASVSYLQELPKEKRVINLEGNAFFRVAKDKHRPFEVHAAGFSTIALGTSFRVIANLNENKVTIQLYTGKVVISKTDSTLDNYFKNVTLYPNQQLVINKETLGSYVASINRNNDNEIKQPLEKANPARRLDWDKYIVDNQLRFSNTPLITIISVIEHHYGISIIYEPNSIKGIVFTGIFKNGDDAQTVLSTLTSVNHLNLLKSNSKCFKITK
jgi:transmembrane sensor